MTASFDVYLELSTSGDAAGQKVGRLPRSIEQRELRDLGHPVSPIKAIRAKCIECSGGSMAEARLCHLTHCPLWAFRMGHNPFYGKADEGDLTAAGLDQPAGVIAR
jgi:hypothetical protein